jgi:hypothetical protein
MSSEVAVAGRMVAEGSVLQLGGGTAWLGEVRVGIGDPEVAWPPSRENARFPLARKRFDIAMPFGKATCRFASAIEHRMDTAPPSSASNEEVERLAREPARQYRADR